MESQTMQTPNANSDTLTNGDVFERTTEGMLLMHDGIEKPLTVTAGVRDHDEDLDDLKDNPAGLPPVMLEGPQGGQKMMNQSNTDRDSVAIDPLTRSSNGGWVSNLCIVGHTDD